MKLSRRSPDLDWFETIGESNLVGFSEHAAIAFGKTYLNSKTISRYKDDTCHHEHPDWKKDK